LILKDKTAIDVGAFNRRFYRLHAEKRGQKGFLPLTWATDSWHGSLGMMNGLFAWKEPI